MNMWMMTRGIHILGSLHLSIIPWRYVTGRVQLFNMIYTSVYICISIYTCIDIEWEYIIIIIYQCMYISFNVSPSFFWNVSIEVRKTIQSIYDSTRCIFNWHMQNHWCLIFNCMSALKRKIYSCALSGSPVQDIQWLAEGKPKRKTHHFCMFFKERTIPNWGLLWFIVTKRSLMKSPFQQIPKGLRSPTRPISSR
jgi:hypothetical protein